MNMKLEAKSRHAEEVKSRKNTDKYAWMDKCRGMG
jgi:hypothetical protein